ncbi:MAG: hypothetical protein NTW19_06050 [Planctomycetota bacterium]|nr:hypothetical protein [Planctomycetota bacterium]
MTTATPGSPSNPGTRYMVEPYLHQRWRRVGRSLAFKATDAAGAKCWRKAAVPRLKEITGYATMLRCPLRPIITETVECDGYTRQRIEIQTEPGVIMPLYALIPAGAGPHDPRPAVLCPHGHDSGGKYCPAGITDIPGVAERVKSYDYDYGVQYAKAGLIAFCPDARGFGERREKQTKAESPDNVFRSSCQYINQMAYPLGQTVTGMWAWDLSRLVDYVLTRKDCNGRVGCAGLSGGGLQTLWATALDDRIEAAVVSGYFYGYEQSLLTMHWNCSCNYVPHLYETMDIGDVAAVIAPRPLLIETGDKDPLNGTDGMSNVTSQLRQTKKAYKAHGVAKNLVHDVFAGGHKWHGKQAVPWMVEQLAR